MEVASFFKKTLDPKLIVWKSVRFADFRFIVLNPKFLDLLDCNEMIPKNHRASVCKLARKDLSIFMSSLKKKCKKLQKHKRKFLRLPKL